MDCRNGCGSVNTVRLANPAAGSYLCQVRIKFLPVRILRAVLDGDSSENFKTSLFGIGEPAPGGGKSIGLAESVPSSAAGT